MGNRARVDIFSILLAVIFVTSLWTIDVSVSAMQANSKLQGMLFTVDPNFAYHLGLLIAVVAFLIALSYSDFKKGLALLIFLLLIAGNSSAQFSNPQQLSVNTPVDADVDMIVPRYHNNSWSIAYQREVYHASHDKNYTIVYLGRFTSDLNVRLYGFIQRPSNPFACAASPYECIRTTGKDYRVDLIPFGGNITLIYHNAYSIYPDECRRVIEFFDYSLGSLGSTYEIQSGTSLCENMDLTLSNTRNYTYLKLFWKPDGIRYYDGLSTSPSGTLFIPADTDYVHRMRTLYSPKYNNYLLIYEGAVSGGPRYIYANYYDSSFNFVTRQAIVTVSGASFPYPIWVGDKLYLAWIYNSTHWVLNTFEQDSSTHLSVESEELYYAPNITAISLEYREDTGEVYAFFSNSTGIYWYSSPVAAPPAVPQFPIITDIRLDGTPLANGTTINITKDSTHTFTIVIYNPTNETYNLLVGLSLGKDYLGKGSFVEFACNQKCYQNPYIRPYDGSKWAGYITIGPHETEAVDQEFKFDSLYFNVGDVYDVVGALWNETNATLTESDRIDEYFVSDVVKITTLPPAGVSAEIVKYEIPNETIQDYEYTLRFWIKNTGSVTSTFYLGLTIGNGTTFVGCNRDCYTDVAEKGDYVNLTLSPQETRIFERKFKFRKEWFEANKSYDVIFAVYHEPYLPFSSRLDGKILYNHVLVKPFLPYAYAIKVVVDKKEVSLGDTIKITAYVHNIGNIAHNFSLGMSIGGYDIADKTILNHSDPEPYEFYPSCNLQCYMDCEKYENEQCAYPKWRFRTIPPNYTAFFTRTMRVPEYFLENYSFDVVVGVWSKPPEEGGYWITKTYFKNVSFVSPVPSAEKTIGDLIASGISSLVSILSRGLGWSEATTKTVIWFVATIFVALLPVALGHPEPAYSIIMVIVSLLVGSMVGWIPAWIAVVLILIAAFIFAKMVGIIGR